ncbi:MAG: ATP-binding protein [Sideroxyarcus sp.]|nr:ATP-binding protein [Sideroxyarcus sp.]
MHPHVSLKQRLLALSLTTVFAVWVVAASIMYFEARDEFDKVLDAHLAQAAALLAVQAEHEIDELDTDHAPLLHKYARKVSFQVWEQGKTLRLHSENAPRVRLSGDELGYSNNTIDGNRWRVFSFWDESGLYLIQVAEQADVRDELANDIAINLLLPLAFLLPLLALLLWAAVTHSLRPLDKLAKEVERRDPETLTPLDTATAPREVMPLIERLNRLFVRIDATMQKDRRFTADAAHELRTPIAAIKAQAQVARGATGNAERLHALDNAILGCDRATHLIEQLLTLARADAPGGGMAEACDLRAIAAGVIALIAPSALERGTRIELAEGDVIVLPGNRELLRILMRNLLDNAVRHTPEGTTILVSIARAQGAVCLSVSDNGGGVTEQEMGRLSERFFRPADTRGSGSGLGLSIVKRIAELHGAAMHLMPSEARQGLCVRVIFVRSTHVLHE